MATSVVPSIIDALVSAATMALPNVKVYDGFQYGVDGGPDVLMIGVDDGQATSASTSESSQTQATAGTPRSRNQTGSINCWALSWTGDNNAKTARDNVYAIQAGVENAMRLDPSLGVARSNGQVLVIQLGGERLTQENESGAAALLAFTIQFEARI